ncbi:hypothetical protein DER45DRAFT_645181 [Fusarium avenaceum]|nr:hypothetical protein DER45DRAFT_645181 [Fusarium avenaceum]
MFTKHYALSESYGMYLQYTGRWGMYWYSEIPLFYLPRLNITEDGEVKIVPGEIYCRWRDAHDDICELEFTDQRDLRTHYRDAHNLRCERPGSASLTRRDNMHVAQWYYDTVRNRMPNWPLIGTSGVVQSINSTRPRSISLPVRHTELGYLILSGNECRQG